MIHQERYEMAKSAIRAVFSDTSVPLKTTLESLQDLSDDLSILIEAVASDISVGE